MNTSFVFQGIQFALYFVVGAMLSIFALKAVSNRSVRSARLFEWNETEETPRWQPLGAAVSTGNFGWTWGRGFGPKWTRQDNRGNTVPVATVASSQFKPTDEHEDARWLGKDKKYFLLVRPAIVVPTWLWVVDVIGVVLIVGALFFAKPSVRVFAVPTPTATRAVSTPVVMVIPTRTIAEATASAQPTAVTRTVTPTPVVSNTPVPLVVLPGQTNFAPIPTPSLATQPTPASTAPSNGNSPIGGLLLILFGVVIGAVGASIYWVSQKNNQQ